MPPWVGTGIDGAIVRRIYLLMTGEVVPSWISAGSAESERRTGIYMVVTGANQIPICGESLGKQQLDEASRGECCTR